ncbi:hypothetical protein CB1_000436040 [Camelus ferus]|nr:hypothetical protein CB1_000436040 [Camelus ferus]
MSNGVEDSNDAIHLEAMMKLTEMVPVGPPHAREGSEAAVRLQDWPPEGAKRPSVQPGWGGPMGSPSLTPHSWDPSLYDNRAGKARAEGRLPLVQDSSSCDIGPLQGATASSCEGFQGIAYFSFVSLPSPKEQTGGSQKTDRRAADHPETRKSISDLQEEFSALDCSGHSERLPCGLAAGRSDGAVSSVGMADSHAHGLDRDSVTSHIPRGQAQIQVLGMGRQPQGGAALQSRYLELRFRNDPWIRGVCTRMAPAPHSPRWDITLQISRSQHARGVQGAWGVDIGKSHPSSTGVRSVTLELPLRARSEKFEGRRAALAALACEAVLPSPLLRSEMLPGPGDAVTEMRLLCLHDAPPGLWDSYTLVGLREKPR